MRIALVNDMPQAIDALRSVLAREPRFKIAWIASNGAEAVRKASLDRPDMILMDLVMPLLDGVEATRQIMAASPCPILIVTESVDGQSEHVYEALGAGAIDVMRTPVLHGSRAGLDASALLFKINRFAAILEVRSEEECSTLVSANGENSTRRAPLIAIGASAGGPAAIAEALRGLPRNFHASIVIVQHIDERFASGLADWLGSQLLLPVRLAIDSERPHPGTVLIAGTADHLVVKQSEILAYTAFPEGGSYRPSIDVFFHSVAENWKERAIGLILTGMGSDGAAGLKAMRDAGHHTIAQDSASSAVSAMPRSAQKLGAAAQILPLARIASALLAELT